MALDPQLTFRAQLLSLLPWWLRGWLGGRIAYSLGIVIDTVSDMLVGAIGLRFPDPSSPDALSALGSDRRIPRGRLEPAAIYASRLQRWLDDHRTRGGPYAMLAQLNAFYQSAPMIITLTYALGKVYTMAVDGTVTTGSTASAGAPWPRWWLRFAWPVAVFQDGLWSSPGTYDDGGVWDSGLSPDAVLDIRNVPTAWNAAHAKGVIYIAGPVGSGTDTITINVE